MSSISYHFIRTDLTDHVFYLTLARPGKRNAFTPTMVNEIRHALQEANNDTAVRVVVIKAEGPVFCAGMDLKAFENPEADTINPDITNADISLGAVIAELNKPSVCIIEGDVYAGGFLIFLECTYVFAKQSVRFSLPEVRIGIFPFQVLASLLKHLPDAKAMDLCIRGTSFTASQAHELGLITDFVENEDDHKIKMLIADLIMGAPLAIKKGFEALKQIKELAATDRYAYLLKVLHELKESEDAKEGLAAQRDKRQPDWKNG
ncbi:MULTISPECIES: enoyl-CoA hydratase/isomerase family protein [unclassified Sphingobacterium]|uniref:enoyl-CoA hydratase/isomerase family protein n=1 Tax=unclassified Sphingobacterium TaxID=2609468 RepID=UPI0025D7BEA3|nr:MULTISPECIES: enoyl-CoA hydratase-related protein [unclassified Sphingobacterium]